MMKHYASQKQDLFAYYLLGKNKTFLDLGCWDPIHCNNTYLLEQNGWSGLLFDTDRSAISSCKIKRPNSKSFSVDVTSRDFLDILLKECPSKHFDYVSLDVDDASLIVLSNYLLSGFTFNCMTFEHDYYRLFDSLKTPSVRLLESFGYIRVFDNVITFPTHCKESMKKYPDGQIFEDWWINPKYFDSDVLQLKSSNVTFEECIRKLENLKMEKKEK